jgi:hypothetical protein
MSDHDFIDTDGYRGPDRRSEIHLTPAQIDRIATKAAEKAVSKMIDDGYRAVGKNVVEKGLWIIGLVACGLFAVATSKGWIKLP